MRKPAIRERVEELRDAPEQERFLARIQANLLLLDNRVGSGDFKDVRQQLNLAALQAKLNRLSERCKQAAEAKLDWRKVNPADLDMMIERELEALSPGERLGSGGSRQGNLTRPLMATPQNRIAFQNLGRRLRC